MNVGPVGRRSGAILGMLVAVGLLVGCAAVGQPSAGTSEGGCAAVKPTLEVRPARALPGASFTLRGENFVGRYACDDAGPTGSGGDAAQGSPARDIRVEFRQDGRTWELGTADAGRKLGFDERFEVPAGARPGRAVIGAVGDDAGAGETAEMSFRVLAERPSESSSGPAPPQVTLSGGGRSEVGASAESVPPAEEAIEVAAGSEVVLGFPEGKPFPMRVTAEPLDGESEPSPGWARELRVRRAGENTLVRPDLPPGDYVLQTSALTSQGRASYGFRLRVEPTRAQLIREERLSQEGPGGVCGFGMEL